MNMIPSTISSLNFFSTRFESIFFSLLLDETLFTFFFLDKIVCKFLVSPQIAIVFNNFHIFKNKFVHEK